MTSPEPTILNSEPVVASAGIELLAGELERQSVQVERVEWRPPVPGAEDALASLALHSAEISSANDAAAQRLTDARPLLSGVGLARDELPDVSPHTLLHAGPPIEWPEMSGPLRGAIIGAALYEGLASDPAEAERMAAGGAFEFGPCHERGAVGPMAGVISSSMPVMIIENGAHGNRAFCTFNEGLGKVLRYGAFDQEVLDRLHWIAAVLAPVFSEALSRLGSPIDIRAMTAQALQMGDECHNRNRAATSLLIRELLPALFGAERSSADLADVARFIAGNDHFYLNLSMPASKVAADAASGVPGSSIVTAMARNGTDFGIRLSGTDGAWFTGPAGVVDGLYLPGFSAADANRDIGDSTITETAGLGGFAMAAAPAIVQFVGGQPEDALTATELMYGISWTQSPSYKIPALDFRGTPTGIDCREVVHSGVLPAVNTGIAHREPGIGQIGAGLVEPPIEAFVSATDALAESLDSRS